jgi:succinyl-diaminopimelate desuccinylase
VVPVGDDAAWTAGPFEAEIKDGVLYGRGAVDMKSAIAAFVAAVSEGLAEHAGSISFLITGDEEGVAEDGTVKVVEALAAEGEIIDHCIVGEPTSAGCWATWSRSAGAAASTPGSRSTGSRATWPIRTARPIRSR